MRYVALATDYDGTLATHGKVLPDTLEALQRFRATGRKLIMVTGRELNDLKSTFDRLDLFDIVVAEDGALLYWPQTHEEKALGESPPPEFIAELRRRGVEPLSVGRVIVATWVPHETTVFEVIRDMGLELHVIFNKGNVMVLPSGINKATGLRQALFELGLSWHNTVGVGDAENDHAFLNVCEFSTAVANALHGVKDRADLVTDGDHGTGVVELIDRIVASDLAEYGERLKRHRLLLGHLRDGVEVTAAAYGTSILLSGSSGGGKTTFATAFVERLLDHQYQFCIFDPEGDYENFRGAVVVGDHRHPPSVDEVMRLLEKPRENVVVNLISVPLHDRPALFESLLRPLLEMRARKGRPHWIVVDETHHLLPASWGPVSVTLPQELTGLMLVTDHPDEVAARVLALTNMIIAIGENPALPLRVFAKRLRRRPPVLPSDLRLEKGDGVIWRHVADTEPEVFRSLLPKSERRRHLRKYAEGELATDRSFYFRGPEGKMKLRAQNLLLFLQMAEGVDDDTWMHHLREGDYSRWFRTCIKDDDLADAVVPVEKDQKLSPEESRQAVRKEVEKRYCGA